MKILIPLFFMICVAQATEFNGYIVKYKGQLPKGVVSHKIVATSFGKFAVIQDKQMLSVLKANPAIEYIEPNYLVHAAVNRSAEQVEDRKFKKQWALHNTGKNSRQWGVAGKVGEDINALKAWGITTGSRDVIVAIIDSGIDYTHPDLKDNIWINRLERDGEVGVDDDGNGYIDDIYGYDFLHKDGDPMDDHGHGTHCAGVIGAAHNNIGIRGIMGQVQLMGLKFLSKKGHGETIDAIAAIDYAIKMGAHIISNSWGGDAYTQSLKDAISTAKRHNILFVVAAGNSTYGHDNDAEPVYPASYKVDNVISVGASNNYGNRAIFSNSGKHSVHVFAPGVNIISTMPKRRYKKMDGTSMAAPLVAGTLGLLLSVEPNISYKEAKNRLMSTADRHPLLNDYTMSGRIDAYKLLK